MKQIRVVASVVLVGALALAATTPAASSAGMSADDFTEQVSFSAVMEHLEAFEEIGDDNDGHRATGSWGYVSSMDYVVEELRSAGYQPELQRFSYTETDGEEYTSWNIIADTTRGDSDYVIVAGAHLDSTDEGPGMNDNASGVAALLEVAKAYQEHVDTENVVRFAFWGAEEADAGMMGSQHYVDSLSSDELDEIDAYLNFDMIASPNYVFGVHDGDESSFDEGDYLPDGTADIEEVFEDFYESRDEFPLDQEFGGDSDYDAFLDAGIPAGGVLTGAGGEKTEWEVETYGGIEGVEYDPCYHEDCDNLSGDFQYDVFEDLDDEYDLQGNVNLYALEVNTEAIAYAVATLGDW